MRIAMIIALMAGLALGLIHIRRQEIAIRHEIQRLQTQQIKLRRKLWDQQVRYGKLLAPAELHRHADQHEMSLRYEPAVP